MAFIEKNKKQPPQVTNGTLMIKLLGWNTSYLCSVPGFLNVTEIILCFVCLHLMMQASIPSYSPSSGGFIGTTQETYFLLNVYSALMSTGVILLSFIISHPSCTLMGRTVGVLLVWLFAFVTSIVTSLFLFISVISPFPPDDKSYGYTSKVTSSVLGIVNSLLYLLSGLLAYRTCKNSWQ